ncbi:MAG: hypothetical protein J6Z31_03780, partial [Fibrobacter sp.]|nr:hypothetical protein [Fibrobacter sp.]
LFRTAELAKFSKEEQKMIDAEQKAKWDAYAIKAYREKEDARLRNEDARLKDEDARLRNEDIRLKNEDARLREENARLGEKESLLKEKETRLQQELSEMRNEKLQLAKILKQNGVSQNEIAKKFHLTAEELESL